MRSLVILLLTVHAAHAQPTQPTSSASSASSAAAAGATTSASSTVSNDASGKPTDILPGAEIPPKVDAPSAPAPYNAALEEQCYKALEQSGGKTVVDMSKTEIAALNTWKKRFIFLAIAADQPGPTVTRGAPDDDSIRARCEYYLINNTDTGPFQDNFRKRYLQEYWITYHRRAADQRVRDWRHIIMAYAVIWFLTIAFVIVLWRRQKANLAQITALQSKLAAILAEEQREDEA